MVKKSTLLAMLVGVVAALAVPAAASAAPSLTMPAATLVPVGTTLTATSSDLSNTSGLGATVCADAMFSVELTENTGSSVKATGITNNTMTGCKLNGNPVTVEDPKLVSLSATSSGKGSASLSFTEVTGVKCFYSGTVPFTYTSGASEIHLSGSLSGPCGASTLTAHFQLSTTKAGGATIWD